MIEEEVPGGWTTEEWTKTWTIHVGKAYKCNTCSTIIMCTKGGVGTLEPICCGNDMESVQAPDEIK